MFVVSYQQLHQKYIDYIFTSTENTLLTGNCILEQLESNTRAQVWPHCRGLPSQLQEGQGHVLDHLLKEPLLHSFLFWNKTSEVLFFFPFVIVCRVPCIKPCFKTGISGDVNLSSHAKQGLKYLYYWSIILLIHRSEGRKGFSVRSDRFWSF